MKALFVILFSLLPLVSASAQTGFSEKALWYEPVSYKTGDTVQLHALIYNNFNISASFQVRLEDNGTFVEEKSITLPAQTGKPISFEWKAAGGEHLFQMTVERATDATGKTLPIDSERMSASVTLGGGVGAKETKRSFLPAGVKEKWHAVLGTIADWREAQLEKFVEKRDALKAQIDAAPAEPDLENLGSPDSVGSTNPAVIVTQVNPMVYLQYFLYLALAALFASVIIFYGLGILLALFIIRFILGRFV